jgi:hypothetical protein
MPLPGSVAGLDPWKTRPHASSAPGRLLTPTWQKAFLGAIERFEYQGAYRGVFPVKVRRRSHTPTGL